MSDSNNDRRTIGRPLSFDDLQVRLSSHVYTSYMNYAFLIKSGVFTIAAISLYHILTEPSREFTIVLFIFWFASFTFAVVTVSTWSRGAAMANARANVGDVVFPIAMSIPEYLFFIAIDPAYAKQDLPVMSTPWTIWYLFFSLHALGACALISNRLRETDIGRDYTADLRPLAEAHIGWARKDRGGAFVSMMVGLFIFTSSTTYLSKVPFNVFQSPLASLIHAVVGMAIIGLGFFIIWRAHSRYNIIEKIRTSDGFRRWFYVIAALHYLGKQVK